MDVSSESVPLEKKGEVINGWLTISEGNKIIEIERGDKKIGLGVIVRVTSGSLRLWQGRVKEITNSEEGRSFLKLDVTYVPDEKYLLKTGVVEIEAYPNLVEVAKKPEKPLPIIDEGEYFEAVRNDVQVQLNSLSNKIGRYSSHLGYVEGILKESSRRVVEAGLAAKEREIIQLKRKLEGVIHFPEAGDDFIKKGLFLTREENNLLVTKQVKITITSFSYGSWAVNLERDDCETINGYIQMQFRTRPTGATVEAVYLLDDRLAPVNHFHSNHGSVCLGDLGSETNRTAFNAGDISKAIDKIKEMLCNVNIDSSYWGWGDNNYLHFLLERARTKLSSEEKFDMKEFFKEMRKRWKERDSESEYSEEETEEHEE